MSSWDKKRKKEKRKENSITSLDQEESGGRLEWSDAL